MPRCHARWESAFPTSASSCGVCPGASLGCTQIVAARLGEPAETASAFPAAVRRDVGWAQTLLGLHDVADVVIPVDARTFDVGSALDLVTRTFRGNACRPNSVTDAGHWAALAQARGLKFCDLSATTDASDAADEASRGPA
ncbi:hypothetical protein M885DRAFT_153255 [Pelagophyceae sp. CCMP2097]|nr:hypothetical protein M885DRAFT_153255 [Pelagophyceae sp. CCMP2097]